MTNSIAIKKALKILDDANVNGCAFSIDGQQIDINNLNLIRFPSQTKTLTKEQKSCFIEFDKTTEKDGIHIWVWSKEHPQYEWIRQNTDTKFWEGIFEVYPNNIMRYVSSIYPTPTKRLKRKK